MRGLEPKFKKSGTRKILGGADCSPSDFRISVPDLELADRATLKIQNGRHKTQRAIKRLIFLFIF